MKIAFIFLISSILLVAQESYTIFSVSPFYTHGKYSNLVLSDSKAIYSSVNFNDDFIISSGVDLISLKSDQWNYNQSSVYLSTIAKFSNLYFKLAGVYLKGKYLDNISETFNYSDENISFTSEVVYDLNWNYFGFAFNYFNSSEGIQILKSSNFTLRYDKFLGYYTYLSVRPNLYLENSGKKFLSLSSKLTYWFSSDFVGNLHFTIGNRRYYFDNDLLTIYNQYDVQKLVAGVGLDYSILNQIAISGGYQHTKFEKFSVNYFYLGLRTRLFFY